MGARARAKRSAWDLPEDERICIWCDGRAPHREFRTREHIVAEGLGGHRDYRLKGGLVCDDCNRRVLKKIDEEVLLLGPIRFLRAQFGLAPKGKDIAQGISYDHADNEFIVDTSKLRNDNAAEFDRIRGVIKMRVAGPSSQARSEHLTRGLHRIAYNALAHRHGGDYVRSRYCFLRGLVLDLEAIQARAFVFDQERVLLAMQVEATRRTRKRWFSTAEVINGADLEPNSSRLRSDLLCSTSRSARVQLLWPQSQQPLREHLSTELSTRSERACRRSHDPQRWESNPRSYDMLRPVCDASNWAGPV